jgi:hypothetical protein
MRCSRTEERTTTNSQVALCVIDELLKIVADGNMFTYEETEQMIETACTSGTRVCPILDELLLNTRKWRSWSTNTEKQRWRGEKVAEAAKTHFEANNAYVDVPMMKDLSKKETCQALIGYTVSIQEQMLAKSPQDVKSCSNFDRRSILISVRRSTIVYDGAPKERTPEKAMHLIGWIPHDAECLQGRRCLPRHI